MLEKVMLKEAMFKETMFMTRMLGAVTRTKPTPQSVVFVRTLEREEDEYILQPFCEKGQQ
jgi:hypothetical protein